MMKMKTKTKTKRWMMERSNVHRAYRLYSREETERPTSRCCGTKSKRDVVLIVMMLLN